MKKIIIAMFLITMASCKKDSTTCYICTFGVGVNGQKEPDREVCLPNGQDANSHTYTDKNGNELNAICTKK